jgi:predicted transcriptional regulator
MRKILISINPEYVELILKKIKRFEYRKSVAKKDVKSIIVYSTYPEMKVVCEVKIDGILEETPAALWEQTHEYGGVEKAFFDAYFAGREKAYAYVLGEVKAFAEPRTLKDYDLKFAPQSFVYINA